MSTNSVSEWIKEYISDLISREPKTRFPLKCGCAGPKYVSMCAVHQELERQKHADALVSGSEVRRMRRRIQELEQKLEGK